MTSSRATIVFDGGTGRDSIDDLDGADNLIRGGEGDDTLISGYSGSTTVDGGDGADYVLVAFGDFAAGGGSGNDTIVIEGTGSRTVEGGDHRRARSARSPAP